VGNHEPQPATPPRSFLATNSGCPILPQFHRGRVGNHEPHSAAPPRSFLATKAGCPILPQFHRGRVGNHEPHSAAPLHSFLATKAGCPILPQFHRGRVGNHEPHSAAPPRSFLATNSGCPISDAVFSRQMWETTNLNQPRTALLFPCHKLWVPHPSAVSSRKGGKPRTSTSNPKRRECSPVALHPNGGSKDLQAPECGLAIQVTLQAAESSWNVFQKSALYQGTTL